MNHDWLCGLVEIKKSARNLEQSRNQIRKYLDVVDTKSDGRVSKDFRAYLVLNGDTTEAYKQHEDPDQQQLPTISTVELTGFCQTLQGFCAKIVYHYDSILHNLRNTVLQGYLECAPMGESPVFTQSSISSPD